LGCHEGKDADAEEELNKEEWSNAIRGIQTTEKRDDKG
jgi:hypothetical protein